MHRRQSSSRLITPAVDGGNFVGDNNSSCSSCSDGSPRRSRISSTSSVSVDEEASTRYRLVEVEAPATLLEGYVFVATLRNNNTSFPPRGGVEWGQTLRVPLLSTEHESEDCDASDDCERDSSRGLHHATTPPGRWKDGLCSCFRFGMCHPHLCNAWLCPQVLLGQVLVRMKMTWLVHRLHPNADDHHDAHDRCGGGKRHTTKVSTSSSSSSSSVQSAFRKIMVLVMLLTVYDSLVAPPLFEVQVDEDTGEVSLASRFSSGGDFPGWHQVLYLLLSLPMTVWGIIVVVRLRASVRQRYNIPTGRLGKWEDLVCVCCCNCCVMSQMARQTADYDGDEPASCCSPSGTRTSNKKDDAMDEVVDCEMNDDATTSTQSLSVPSSPSSLTSSSAIASDSCHVNSSGSARSRRPDGRINQSRQEISRPCTMATVV